MVHKIHYAMQQRENLYQIGVELEMDDSYFGERHVSGKRGRGAEKKALVLVAVQTRRVKDKIKPAVVKMHVINQMTAEAVKDFVHHNIRPASTIKTDGFKSYQWLGTSEYHFKPVPVVNPKEASQKLPWVHILIGNIKGSIRGVHHGVSGKYLKHYLIEYCYKFNRRFIEKSMFTKLLNNCALTQTITFAELRA
jgi:transposase-like protein